MEFAVMNGKSCYAEPGVYGQCSECGGVALPRRTANSEDYHWYHKKAGGCSLAFIKKVVSVSHLPSRKPDKPLIKISILGNKEHYVQKQIYQDFKEVDKLLKSGGDVELIPKWFTLLKNLKVPHLSIAGKWGFLKGKLINTFEIEKESLSLYDAHAQKSMSL